MEAFYNANELHTKFPHQNLTRLNEKPKLDMNIMIQNMKYLLMDQKMLIVAM
jgi:hypothetical protein